MTSSGNSGDGSQLGHLGSQLAASALQALPPEVQDLLKPGPQSDRINRAIGWAARHDPQVIKLHQEHGGKDVHSIEDIRAQPLERMDRVAQEVTRRYRHRAAFTGALTGLPGGLWALVAAGADVQLTAIYAVRMAAGVAQSYGYDTSQPEEMAQLAEVLALVAGVDSLRGIGNWLTREGLIHYLPEVLPKLLTRIGAEVTKEQAAKVVGRLVPGVGAAIGGAIDYSFLRVAGDKAIAFYHHRYLVDHGLIPPQPAQTGHAIAAVPPGIGQQIPAPSRAALPGGTPAGGNAPAVQIPHSTPKPRERPPERFGVYLAIFAVFALFITIAACAALILLASSSIQNLFHASRGLHELSSVAAALLGSIHF